MIQLDIPESFDSSNTSYVKANIGRMFYLTTRWPFTWEDLEEIEKISEQVLERARGLRKRKLKAGQIE